MITKHKRLRTIMMRKTKGHQIYFIVIITIILWILIVSSFSSLVGINNNNSFNKIDLIDSDKTTRSNDQNDTTGPVISAVNITPINPKTDEEIAVSCVVTDISEIIYVKIYYCTASFCTMQMPMDSIGENKYKNICVPNSLPTGIVEYHIIAKDALNNTNEYNDTFEILDTLNNSENSDGDGESCSTPGFDIIWLIVGVSMVSIILSYKRKKSNK